MVAAGQTTAASDNRRSVKCRKERKVRTPEGSAPGNARAGQPDGKWHRKHTACREPGGPGGVVAPIEGASHYLPPSAPGSWWVRVKRCGKSAPRPWQHGWQAKPRTEQDQIGWRSRTARPTAFARATAVRRSFSGGESHRVGR